MTKKHADIHAENPPRDPRLEPPARREAAGVSEEEHVEWWRAVALDGDAAEDCGAPHRRGGPYGRVPRRLRPLSALPRYRERRRHRLARAAHRRTISTRAVTPLGRG